MKKQEEFQLELNKLEYTREWVRTKVDEITKNDENMKNRIASLKKASKGAYSEELETTEKLYEIVKKNLMKYNNSMIEPYFSRIDFREYRKEKESYYIGKFGLGDLEKGEEVVIDWRAPIADLYYSGTQGDTYYRAPIGIINGELSLKRKFLFKEGELKDIFDEGINDIIIRSTSDSAEGNALMDEFLRINLEESTGKKLKEVVATIQKEQNQIIRAEKNRPIIVQGSAGSGKTTVALHRLAYLMYRYKDKIKAEDIMVIAPNKLFLDYISEVLPNLGVDMVKQVTFEELCLSIIGGKYKVYTKDKKLADILEEEDESKKKYVTNCSKVKGSMIFKTMLDRYIQVLEREDSKVEDIKVEEYVLFSAAEIRRLYLKDTVNLPLNKRKEEIKRYLGLKLKDRIIEVLEKIDFFYEYTIARVKKTMEEGAERRKKLIEVYDERDEKKRATRVEAKKAFDKYFEEWKGLNTSGLYLKLFQEEEVFKEVAANKIPEPLVKYMREEIITNFSKGMVDSDDLAPMLYIKFSIEGVDEKYKYAHIVIDEAQDYSPLQMKVVKSIARGDSVTIVGDIGQGIYYYKGIEDWNNLIEEIFEGDANYVALTQSYRSTIEIIEYANRVLMKQKNSLKPAIPVLRHGKEPTMVEVKNLKEFAQNLEGIIQEVENLGKKTIAIIGRTQKECKAIKEGLKKQGMDGWKLIKENETLLNLDKIIIPSYMTKGLEFDCSIIYNLNKSNYGEKEIDKRLLYVVMTRALHLEYIFYQGEPSTLI